MMDYNTAEGLKSVLRDRLTIEHKKLQLATGRVEKLETKLQYLVEEENR